VHGVWCVNSQETTYCRQFPIHKRGDHEYVQSSPHASQMSANPKPGHKSNIPSTTASDGLALLMKETPVKRTSSEGAHCCVLTEIRKNVRVWQKPGHVVKVTYDNVQENEARNMGYTALESLPWDDASSNHNHVGGGNPPATNGDDLPEHTPSAGATSTPSRVGYC
jgi:hypothetical protein